MVVGGGGKKGGRGVKMTVKCKRVFGTQERSLGVRFAHNSTVTLKYFTNKCWGFFCYKIFSCHTKCQQNDPLCGKSFQDSFFFQLL